MLVYSYRVNQRSISGFSLIELMFALLISLVITGGVFSLYTSTRDTQRSSQEMLQMVADARFAMDAIAYDIRHAGSYGTTSAFEAIACRAGDDATSCPAALPAIAGDCANNWYNNALQSIIGSNNVNSYSATCATVNYVGGTDVLGVKYADTSPIATAQLDPNQVYVRANVMAAQIFIPSGTPPWQDLGQRYFDDDNLSRNHRLIARAYYVSNYTDLPGDGWPSLRRAELGPGPTYTSAVLVPGVEDMQIEYGVDLNRNGRIDSYVNSTNIPAMKDAVTPDWSRVHAVKVWLLMRSQRVDRDGVPSSQTFTIANAAAQTYNTGHHRMLFSNLVYTRNMRGKSSE